MKRYLCGEDGFCGWFGFFHCNYPRILKGVHLVCSSFLLPGLQLHPILQIQVLLDHHFIVFILPSSSCINYRDVRCHFYRIAYALKSGGGTVPTAYEVRNWANVFVYLQGCVHHSLKDLSIILVIYMYIWYIT